jgi:putative phosphonate metabolism protein
MNAANTDSRYAIYYAPPEESALWAFGSAWLGRDARAGNRHAPVPANGFTAARLDEITRDAAVYGFHATLKPPFRLAAGTSEGCLLTAVQDFAAGLRTFSVPPLALGSLDGFVALVLSRPCPPFHALADACVAGFDRFRRPPLETELIRRRKAGLTARQEEYLVRWGYPYVFDDWRFHMTLTCRLDDEERRRVIALLAPIAAPALAAAPVVDSLCLFRQQGEGRPFRLMARVPFGG